MEMKRFRLPARIDSLQALRFFGAMCITVYHFSGIQGSLPFDFSHAVYLFYMVSGFVVMLSTDDPKKKKFFLTRRLIRVLPLYWGLTVLTFAAGLMFPSLIGYRPTAEQLIKSLLFIPYRRATARASEAIRPLVGLGHTLQYEMLFYLFFMVAMHISHKRRGYIAAGFAAAAALVGVFFPTKEPVVHFYTANRYAWAAFIAGLACYGFFDLLQRRVIVLKTGALPIAGAAVAALFAVPVFITETSVWYDLFMFFAVLCAGLVWSACGRGTPRVLVIPGNISFSYYLIHYYTVTLSARLLGINSFSLRNLLLAAAVTAATWGISWVSWYLVEKKFSGYLLSKLPA
ncbi:MAG: acyltransferase [Clostridia bacterium]|nr:acyltransferase [Clostridia bacterium]